MPSLLVRIPVIFNTPTDYYVPVGIISASPPSNVATAPAQTLVSNVSSLVLPANASRKRFRVLNSGTTVIKIGYGTAPTQTAYHHALRSGGSADDGSSEALVDDLWVGDVHAISDALGGKIVIVEFT